MREHVIPACQGRAIDVARRQLLSVTDVEGGQVVDFFAESAQNPNEFVSPGGGPSTATNPCG